MAEHDIIVVGTSAGGIEVLSQMVRGLPVGLPASVFIVCHLPTGARSALPEILSREGPLLASHAVDDEPFHPGQIYVAPPDWHLMVGPDRRMRLSKAARENRHRPAVDPLFRSAARHCGPKVIGVILSGALSDGVAGLMAVRAAGGLAVVQDPDDATISGMPQNAVNIAGADHVVKAVDLARLLTALVQHQAAPNRSDELDTIDKMEDIVEEDMDGQSLDVRRGKVSIFTCPECGGALWQTVQPELIQFRCHVGHLYNGEILLAEQSEALEAALWTAIRTFREKSILALQLARQVRAEGNVESADRFEEQSRQAARYGSLIRRHLLKGDSETDHSPGAAALDGLL